MALESCTIEDYLTRPYPRLSIQPSGSHTLTVNDKWDPIEGLTPFVEFNDDLRHKFRDKLKKLVTPHDAVWMMERGGFLDIFGEDTVTPSALFTTFFAVNNCLAETNPGWHIGPGSKFFRRQSDGNPDWGLGHSDYRNEGLDTYQNFLPIDLKISSKWSSDGLLEIDWDNYLDDPDLRNKALPFEQTQHYDRSFGTRYSCIVTETGIVVIRFSYSTDAHFSPKPSRKISHRRVLSDISSISAPFSNMSIDPSEHSMYSAGSSGSNPAPLEIAQFSYWPKKGSKMTPNLALFLTCQLVIEDWQVSTSYPPLSELSPKSKR
ncbi:hypothetical protein F5884DRAFT_253662 [Xylogone sp. PMI_703]|nr:hypothetical protein F5884DRAFT_253662 [Xylogone sp. PMI_703]